MYDIGTVDYAVYEDGDEFLGIASVTLPDKNSKVATINGAGIGGDVEIPMVGHYDAMTLSLTFRTYTARTARLRERRRHQIELRIAQQDEDPVSGTIPITDVKHVFICVPKSASGGEIAPAAPGNISVVFSVRYWATYIKGKKVDEIDQLNRVDIINGIDYNADVRKALGK
jgi:P2 family phage contractile tail tube protein